jgi:hypothetical protein
LQIFSLEVPDAFVEKLTEFLVASALEHRWSFLYRQSLKHCEYRRY